MSPISWALRPLKRYAVFSGRAPRAEFWWFFLFLILAYIALTLIFVGSIASLAAAGSTDPAGVLGTLGGSVIFIVLFWLAVLIPTIAVQVRRLHDTGRSGWWIGSFYLLYLLSFVVTFSGASGGAESSAAISIILSLGIFVYSIVLLVFYCLPGTKGSNRYGPDPYGPDNLHEVFA